ncbi:MAG: TonB family protein [Gammaproteobacteria bacterium]
MHRLSIGLAASVALFWCGISTAQDASELTEQIASANSQSSLFIKQGQIDKALASAKTAYELALGAWGVENIDTAVLTANYARLLNHVGSHSAARPLFEAALKSYEQTHSETAVELVPVLMDFAEASYGALQRELVDRALTIQRASNPTATLAHAHLAARGGALIASTNVDKDGAVPMLENALSVFETNYGEASMELATLLMSLGDAHTGTAKRDAIPRRYYARAIKIAQASGDPIVHADFMHKAGLHLMSMAGSPKGRRYLDDAYQIFEKNLGQNHIKTANAALSMARFQLASRRPAKAEPYLTQAVSVFEKAPQFRNHHLKTLGLLVDTYEQLGERDKATPYCRAIGKVTPWVEDQDVVPLVRVAPRYPASAQNRAQQGRVSIALTIDQNGFVTDPKVVESVGPKVFEQAAVDAIKRWRFAPSFVGGEPQPREITQIIRFAMR